MMENDLRLILTSAGVAALVSSIIGLIGQVLERKSRRRELLFREAIAMAAARTAFAERRVEKGARVKFYDPIALAETYHRWLTHLHDHGELPPDAAHARTPIEKKYRGQEVAETDEE